jgi:ABC-type lipoprotein export system ATPase subunit
MPPLLKLENVTKRYDSPQGGDGLAILNGISLEVLAGESLAVMGPSGSGKSTLLQIIGTLDRPTSGEVSLEGRELNRLNEQEIAMVRNRQLGFIFQAHYLLPQCTVLENVLVPTLALPKRKKKPEIPESIHDSPTDDASAARFPGRPTAAVGAKKTELVELRARRLLNRVGLGNRLDHRPGQLSGGECQRVAVVRALINQPKLLLADEPTGSLDHASAQRLSELLSELNKEEGVALIVVTHARELAEKMGKVWQLQDGRLI